MPCHCVLMNTAQPGRWTSYVLPQDFVESRSWAIMVWTFSIALKFDRHFGRLLPRCLSHLRAIWSLQHPVPWHRDFTRFVRLWYWHPFAADQTNAQNIPWSPRFFYCVFFLGFYGRSWWIHEITLLWRHNGRDGVSNHQHHDCLLHRLFKRRSKKTSKLRVAGFGNSPGTGEFPAQMASNAENVFIWWRHHEIIIHILQGCFPGPGKLV